MGRTSLYRGSYGVDRRQEQLHSKHHEVDSEDSGQEMNTFNWVIEPDRARCNQRNADKASKRVSDYSQGHSSSIKHGWKIVQGVFLFRPDRLYECVCLGTSALALSPGLKDIAALAAVAPAEMCLIPPACMHSEIPPAVFITHFR